MVCNIFPIGNCAPYANHGDVVTALTALAEPNIGDIALATDPLTSPAAALAEGFPNGLDPNCPHEVLFLRKSDGSLYISGDSGASWIALQTGEESSVQIFGVLNNSGITLNPGNVVVWDFTADKAIKTTTTANALGVAGVWLDTTLHGSSGGLISRGLASVEVDSAVSRGNILVTSTTAGKATPLTNTMSPHQGVVGVALEDLPGSGTVLAFVDAEYGKAFARYYDSAGTYAASATIATAETWADVDATNLNLTIVTRGRPVKIKLNGFLYETSGSVANVGRIDVLMDGTTRLGNSSRGLYSWDNAEIQGPRSLEWVINGIPAGSHSFKLQWTHGQNSGSLKLESLESGVSANQANFIPVEFSVEEL